LGLASSATPLLIQFVPFPVLEDTRQFSGTVEVRLTHTVGRGGGGRLARIYVLTEHGRIEMDCGYFTDRTTCPDFNLIDGSVGRVWYDSLFGVVQWRLVDKPSGRVSVVDFESSKFDHENKFYGSKYLPALVSSVVFLVAAIFIFRRNEFGKGRR
jgi:hypothetical protein